MKNVRPRRRSPKTVIKEVTAIILLITGLLIALSGLADAILQLGIRLGWW